MERGVRIIAVLLLWLVPATIFYTAFSSAWDHVWQHWKVPSISPGFIDLRSITAGIETERHGGDALVANPYDRMQRPVNYPRVWLYLFAALHINERNLPAVGICFSTLFLLCISILILRSLGSIEALILLMAGLSWASLFAMERGNSDLFIFAVLFLGCVSNRESVKLAAYSLAALLKIFPVAALILHTLWKPARERIAPLFATLGVLAILLFQWRDLNAIRRGTPTEVWFSYGILSLKMQALRTNGLITSLVVLLSSWLLIVLTMWRAWLRGPQLSKSLLNTKASEMFVIFGGIYVFSFLAGANFDYRLIFLLPTMPFAFQLIRGTRHMLLGCIYVALVLVAENPVRLPARHEAVVMHLTTLGLALIALTLLTDFAKHLSGTWLSSKRELASAEVHS